MSMAYDSEAKKAWVRENVVFVGVKLFRPINGKRNDGDIIDFLAGKVKGEIVKAALREYIERHEPKGEHNMAMKYVVWTQIKNGDAFNSKTYHTLDDAREAAQMEICHLTDREKQSHSISIYGWASYDPNGDIDAEWIDPEFVEEML